MLVFFRADASLEIGTGHVMRCLTLAGELTARGAECQFICRRHPGNLIDYVCSKGFIVHELPLCEEVDNDLIHSSWLGSTQIQDAQACMSILKNFKPDWLVTDHYALDARWESTLQSFYSRGMVIDDLADRPHVCHLLLDQTLGRNNDDYSGLVPKTCNLLCGSTYALLRPEFLSLRDYSLKRRIDPEFKRLLITLGGVDKENMTCAVLETLRTCDLPNDCEITIVMGTTAPWLNNVRDKVKEIAWRTNVQVGVSNMAHLMAYSDFAIGAAGATSWERCCLGVPTITLVLAENQSTIASNLKDAGAAEVIGIDEDIKKRIPEIISDILKDRKKTISMIARSSALIDGQGLYSVANSMNI